jgi:serine/threonine-protein kinase
MSPDRQADSLALAQQVDALCDRFEEALRAGKAGDWRDWLPPAGPARRRALAELARLDLEHRLRAGEPVRAEAYLARCPELKQDAEAVLALITREYEVRRLRQPELTLADYDRRFPDLTRHLRPFERPGAQGQAPPATLPLAAGEGAPPDLPTVTGYEILSELGRGAFGVVYKARQGPLRRVVALKMLKAGAGAFPEERVRLQTEAQALARLQHPHIVQVYEVGEHDGRLYLALEYAAHGSLAERLGGVPLPPPAAARLAEALARAVQAAHAAGIVHRDLKPGNILLAGAGEPSAGPADGAPGAADPLAGCVPKVADFGLAKLLVGGDGTLTRTGAVLGTPCYMAPEQAGGGVKAVGPAADVYALGAILYECLTGRPPFQGATVYDTLEQVRQREPVAPRALQPKVPRDLETVCLKCLHKEPQRRYAGAQDLADDLRRFLDGRPVRARPVGPAERLARWVRRRPARAGVLALSLLLVGAGTGGLLTYQQWQIEQARRGAEQRQAVEAALAKADGLREQARWREAQAVLDQARQLLGGAGPGDLRQRLGAAEAQLALVSRLDTIRQHRATWVEGHFLDDPTTTARECAAAFREAGLGEVGDDEETVAARVRASGVPGPLVAALDDWAFVAAEPASRAWLLGVARRADPDPWRDRFRDPAVWGDRQALRALADEALRDGGAKLDELSPQVLAALGLLLYHKGADAVPLLRAAQHRYPSDFWLNLALGAVLSNATHYEEAVGYCRVAVALRPGVAAAHCNLGVALHAKKDLDGAVAAYQKAVGIDPKLAPAHTGLGLALHAKKDLDGAIAAYQKAIGIDPKLTPAHINLGNALRDKGDLDGAIAEYQEATALDPRLAPTHYNLGLALYAKKDLDGAIAAYQKAVGIDPKLAPAHYNLGNALYEKKDLEGAVAAYRMAIDSDRSSPAASRNERTAVAAYRVAIDSDPKLAAAHNNLGNALRAKGDRDGAIAAYRTAVEIDPKDAPAHNNLGTALCEKKDLAGAIAAYQRAIALDPDFPEAHCNLGQVLREQGRFAEALEELRRGHALGSRRPGWSHPSADWVRQAEQLVERDRKLAAVLAGQAEPADAAEWLTLAQLCGRYKRLHATAARFYAGAFAADPRLAADLGQQHRYNAACSAALAAAGQGEDAKRLPDKLRPMLRRQALAWLRDDLTAYAKLAERAEPAARQPVREKMRHWQQDADLAPVRDQEALDRLPDDERQSWRQLWDDVGALLKKVEETK